DQVDAPLEAVLEVDLVPSGDGDAVGDDDHARLLPRSGPWYRAPRFPPPMRRLRVPRTRRPRLTAILLSLAVAAVVRAELSGEAVGKVTTLPVRPGPHWFWLSDILLHRTALFDADTGELLGTLSAGTAGVGFVIAPLFAPDHREVYLPETFYSRGVRGDRTDVVTVYDASTLQPLDEIGIPPRRAEYFPGNAANALSDDGRFAAVFNLTPVTSLSIVDVKARRFTTEVPTPGCSLVYAAGPRRFLMLCANGAALTVALDDTGQAAHVERTEPFYDPGTHRRVQRIPVVNPLAGFVGEQLAQSGRRRAARFTDWLLPKVLPNPGVERILVTQDEHPVLVASASIPPTLTIHDAMTGAVVRHISEPGLAGSLLFTP